MDYVLWTRKAVGERVQIKLGIDFPVRTVGGCSKRWGITGRKPVKQAHEQSP
ncbi:MAG: winged helix-turn-helix domain-containing protein [Gammaproteobacteria bacterium]|nr:winged helix-turn-helix domain-containing protein [Gammaproteobacteria bacterium]